MILYLCFLGPPSCMTALRYRSIHGAGITLSEKLGQVQLTRGEAGEANTVFEKRMEWG